MEKFSPIHLDLNYAYIVLFFILGAFSIYTQDKMQNKSWLGYRKSRRILGSAFFLMTAYCILRAIHPQFLDNYGDFWLLTVVSLTFTWLNYTSFLFLINTQYVVRRRFFIDGAIPLTLMFVIGGLGEIIPTTQEVLRVLLGVVYIGKSLRMFYVCKNEWKKINREQQNNLDEAPDILWMLILVWLTLLLSLCTLIALYEPAIHVFYCCAAPLVFVYMTIKLVNYMPIKIIDLRGELEGATGNANESNKQPAQTQEKTNGIEAKIAPIVQKWVQEKKYCHPNLCIKEVAVQMGTNHNYLSSYLNNTLQVTFQIWLNSLRIEEAQHILLSEPLSIEEVGIKVGIPESYNFSRWFKTITGTTPLKYRKAGNKNQQQVL